MANLPKPVNILLIIFTVTFYRIVSQLLRSKGVRWMVAMLFAGKLFLIFMEHFYPYILFVPFLNFSSLNLCSLLVLFTPPPPLFPWNCMHFPFELTVLLATGLFLWYISSLVLFVLTSFFDPELPQFLCDTFCLIREYEWSIRFTPKVYIVSQECFTFRLRICIGVRHSECRRLFRQDEADQRGFLHDALCGGGGQALQGQVLLHQAKPSSINSNAYGPEFLHLVSQWYCIVSCVWKVLCRKREIIYLPSTWGWAGVVNE